MKVTVGEKALAFLSKKNRTTITLYIRTTGGG
jgi:hypothetical protein